MKKSTPSFDIPKRLSLSAQAAIAIRKAIEQGAWHDRLPSERRLCSVFKVSRPTIRTALHLLAKEGLLDVHPGRRGRLLPRPLSRSGRRSRLVVLVTHEPVSHLTTSANQGAGEMRAHLADHGFVTEVLVCPPHSARVQQRMLETFFRHNPVFCCVLMSVGRVVQEWFAERPVPALVYGSCYPGMKLPYLDWDYHAVCRHAAGTFLGKGHRRLALILPKTGLAGDLASEAGFREAVSSHPSASSLTVLRHSGSVQSMTAKLNALFNSPAAPTALLVARTENVFAVIIYLLRRGITMPDTISLIARDNDHIFEGIMPIAHYQFGDETFAKRLSRLMLRMVDQGFLAPEPNLILPRYVPGSTVRSVRE